MGRRLMLYLSKLMGMFVKKQVLVVFLLAFGIFVPAAAAQARGLTSSEASLLNTMNAARKSNGLTALRVDFHLVRAARGHSADMMRRQYFAHGSVAGRALAAGAPPPGLRADRGRVARLTPPRGGARPLAPPPPH